MRCQVIVVVFTLSIVAAGQEVGDPTAKVETEQYAAAVNRGRAEADAELKSDKASIWTYGHLPPEFFRESLDRETGLYTSSFGCVVDCEILGRVAGHNARIAEYVRDHGPPQNSFKPWERELYGLKDYFETRCRTEKPIRLNVGGSPVISSNGEYAIKLVKHPDRTFEGLPTESTWIVIGEQDVKSRRTSLWMKDAEFFWGPKHSWFAVLRGHDRTADKMDYMALDLRHVRSIRLEFGDSNTKSALKTLRSKTRTIAHETGRLNHRCASGAREASPGSALRGTGLIAIGSDIDRPAHGLVLKAKPIVAFRSAKDRRIA